MNVMFNTSALCMDKSSLTPQSNSVKKTGITKDYSSILTSQINNVNSADSYKYLDVIKENIPQATVNVKSMTAADVQNYYNEWKNQPINYGGSRDITISPNVLKKMEDNPKYAEEMLQKINKAAVPEGFGNATIYEYKVIVRDDGQIETLACADFMNGKKNNRDDEDEDEDNKKKIELKYLHRKLYKQDNKAQLAYLYSNNNIPSCIF